MITKQELAEDLFEVALIAAEKRNSFAMKKLIEKGFSLSQRKGEYTLVMLLSEQGKTMAVDFLINKFNDSLNEAAVGAGRRGDFNRVMKLYEKGASLNYGLLGLASGGHVEYGKTLLRYKLDPLYALIGYIKSGLTDLVDLIIEAESDPNKKEDLIKYAAAIYASVKNVTEAKRMQQQGASPECLIYGYALGNHEEELQDLVRNQLISWPRLGGYAYRGNYNKVFQEILLAYPFNEQNYELFKGVLLEFAMGNHRELELRLRKAFPKVLCNDDLLLDLLAVYAKSGNITVVNQIIKANGGRLFSNKFQEKALASYVLGGYVTPSNILRLLCLTEDGNLRKDLADYMATKFFSYDKEQLLKNSKFIQKVMIDYQLGFEESKNLSPGVEYWILQGIHAEMFGGSPTKGAILPKEVFWYILKWVLDSNDNDTVFDIYLAVHNHLCRKMIQAIPQPAPTFFSTKRDILEMNKEYETRKSKIITKYNERIKETGYGGMREEELKKQEQESDSILTFGLV